jgi:uncharacterized membrane protein YsdA (DUF1294 family)
MNTIEIAVFAYLAFINVAAFLAFGIDKRRALKGSWRTPEATLHTLGLLGGFIGGYAGMGIFRHKSSKISFRVVFFLASAVSCAALIYLASHSPWVQDLL